MCLKKYCCYPSSGWLKLGFLWNRESRPTVLLVKGLHMKIHPSPDCLVPTMPSGRNWLLTDSPLFRGQLGTLGGNSPWGGISSPPSNFDRRVGEISPPPSKFHRRVGEISSPPCRYPPHSPFQILILWKMLEELWFKYIWGVGTRVKLPKVKLHESESLGSQN